MKNGNVAEIKEVQVKESAFGRYGIWGSIISCIFVFLLIVGLYKRASADSMSSSGVKRDEGVSLAKTIENGHLAKARHSYRHSGKVHLAASRCEGALTWFRIENWSSDASWFRKIVGKVAATVHDYFFRDGNGAYIITGKGYSQNEVLADGYYVHIAKMRVECNGLFGTHVCEYPVYLEERLVGTEGYEMALDKTKVVKMVQNMMRKAPSVNQSYKLLLSESGGLITGVGPLTRYKVDVL